MQVYACLAIYWARAWGVVLPFLRFASGAEKCSKCGQEVSWEEVAFLGIWAHVT